jgi:hypothetical protein
MICFVEKFNIEGEINDGQQELIKPPHRIKAHPK